MDGPWSQGLFQECVYTGWNMVLVPDRPYFPIWSFEVVDESGNPIGSRLSRGMGRMCSYRTTTLCTC